MRILFLGTDRNLLTEGSAVHKRFARFAALFPEDSFATIVFSTRAHDVPRIATIAPNMHAYATDSRSKLLYGLDAIRLAYTLQKPDIISAQDPFETGFAAWCMSRLLHVPYATEVHTDALSPIYAQHSLLNRLRVRLAGFVLRRAVGGYAVSEKVRDALVERFNLAQPFGVLPIVTDIARFRALVPATKHGALLWIGRMAPEKRPNVALGAVAEARAHGNEVTLTMLGDGPLLEALKSQARALGIEKHVSFPGWGDPAEYLPYAELLLVTSEYEGYGMAMVEALAAGVPVLATDVGIAREAGAVIAEDDYALALRRWLAGDRARGVLTLSTYRDEEEYFHATRDLYANFLARP